MSGFDPGANLFVDTTGQFLRIGDFGAAACLYTKTTCPGEFRGQMQGTLAFIAPEVIRSECYGRSCDMWSLGCCVIEMATAKAPWNASVISNYYCLMYKVLTSMIGYDICTYEKKLWFQIACSNEPPSVPTHLSPGLQFLTSSCLQLTPEHRPQARDLLHHPLFHWDLKTIYLADQYVQKIMMYYVKTDYYILQHITIINTILVNTCWPSLHSWTSNLVSLFEIMQLMHYVGEMWKKSLYY